MTRQSALHDALVAQARCLAKMARDEDLGSGDITGSLLQEPGEGRGRGRFRLLAKQEGVFAGREIAQAVLDVYESGLAVSWLAGGEDGTVLTDCPVELAYVEGPVSELLAAERVLLNFLQRLCGVATLTRRFVDAVAGTGAVIMDTRKTTPGWRLLEKYAVRCGGGWNHRMGLYDAILIKDNHLAAFTVEQTGAAVTDLLKRAASLKPPPAFVEVEADCLARVEQLLRVAGVDVVMLDNFAVADVRRAVELRDTLDLRDKVKLEASGGVTLDTVRSIAATGVDRISIGAITHSAVALDLSLKRVE